jgi:hypothetical protein
MRDHSDLPTWRSEDEATKPVYFRSWLVLPVDDSMFSNSVNGKVGC